MWIETEFAYATKSLAEEKFKELLDTGKQYKLALEDGIFKIYEGEINLDLAPMRD